MISLSVMKMKTAIVIPNWNGEDSLRACLDSLLKQTEKATIIVVDNGSVDGSLKLLEQYSGVIVLPQPKNLGFDAGVNIGIRRAIDEDCEYVALFNNDAVADKNWLRNLISELDDHPDVGISAPKFMSIDKEHLDSTGDFYTSWGLPFPRGRDEVDSGQYDHNIEVFGATGGASAFRISMLKQLGLFDEDFFAYYEDIDISFRAQLAGWKVHYVPAAIAYHDTGSTSRKIKGFTTYQTLKNLPWIYWKNVPLRIAVPMFPKIFVMYWTLFVRACLRGNIVPAVKGAFVCHILMFKKFSQRRKIQRTKTVSNDYIRSIIIYNVPPNAYKLRRFRSLFVRD